MIQIEVVHRTCNMRMEGSVVQCLSEAMLAINRLYVNLGKEAPEFGELFREAVESGLPWRKDAAEESIEIRVSDTGRRGN